MRYDTLKITSILIPKIEAVLNYNITPYEKCILIKEHIANWRETK